MQQETTNESVRTLLLLLTFAAIKLVARIVLLFILFITCDHILFKFLTLGFQR